MSIWGYEVEIIVKKELFLRFLYFFLVVLICLDEIYEMGYYLIVCEVICFGKRL